MRRLLIADTTRDVLESTSPCQWTGGVSHGFNQDQAMSLRWKHLSHSNQGDNSSIAIR